MANRWGNNGNSVRLYFWGSKITSGGDCSHEIKRRLLLGGKVMTNLDWSDLACVHALEKECLENPRIRGTWWAAVYGDTQSWTWLKRLSSSIRQHIKKLRDYVANKGPSSQSYCFSCSHVWMWELDYKESWALKNRCFWTVLLEKTLQSSLNARRSNHSILKEIHPEYSLEGWMLRLKF